MEVYCGSIDFKGRIDLNQVYLQCEITKRGSETWLSSKHRRRLARMEKIRAIKTIAHEIACFRLGVK